MPRDEFLKNDAFLTGELLRVALEAADIAVWKADPQAGQVELSSAMKRMMGLGADQQIAYDDFFTLLHPEDREAVRAAVDAALKPDGDGGCAIEFRLGNEGEPKWFSASGRALAEGDGADRRSPLFVGTLSDITARKNFDAGMQSAIDQQRELVHEVNHRFKNSLQLLSSLLRLQARRAPETATQRQLEDATARLSTIAHIHERLYRDQDIKQLRFGAFVRELCSDLQGSASHCSLRVDSPEFMITTDRAIPLALIINELVTNAFKYAYPADGGPVMVNVENTADGKLTVTVGDEGVGLAADFTIDKATSLGMVLVRGMVQQMNGRLEVRNVAPGVTFILTAATGAVGRP